MSHLPKTQFVIADSSRARWVRRSGQADDFVTMKAMHAEKLAHGSQGGVVFESSSGARFGVEEADEAVRAHHERFAHQVADAINAEAAAGAFERLAVVAPAHTLSAISDHLNQAARDRLAKTLAKDLTKTPDHELGDWLRSLELG